MIPKFAKVTNFSPLHKKNNIRADSGGGLIHQEEGAGKARKRQMRQEEADDGDGAAGGRHFWCPPAVPQEMNSLRAKMSLDFPLMRFSVDAPIFRYAV